MSGGGTGGDTPEGNSQGQGPSQANAQAPMPSFCDFCGQATTKVGPMVEGNALLQGGLKNQKSHICAECVKTCDGIFLQHQQRHALDTKLPTPRELVAHLDNYIIGQERVKKTLAVAVVNHYKRLLAGSQEIDDEALKDVEIAKS